MIALTKLSGDSLVLNAELIQQVEALPHTVITLTNGEKLLVREPVDDVVDAVIRYKRRIHGTESPGREQA